MEYLVSDCSKCGGWCCRCVSVHKNFFSQPIDEHLPKFWRQITFEEAKILNPWLPSCLVGYDLSKDYNYFVCPHLEDGLCSYYSVRPETCREYPDFDAQFEIFLENPDAFYTPWCYYRRAVLEILGIEYETLNTGEECETKYREKLAATPELAQKFLNLSSPVCKTCQSSMDGTPMMRQI